MMGMSSWEWWLSHYISLTAKALLLAGLLTLIWSSKDSGLGNDDLSLLFAFLALYGLNAVAFAAAVTAVSSSRNQPSHLQHKAGLLTHFQPRAEEWQGHSAGSAFTCLLSSSASATIFLVRAPKWSSRLAASTPPWPLGLISSAPQLPLVHLHVDISSLSYPLGDRPGGGAELE